LQASEYLNIYRLEDTHWWYQGTYALVSSALKKWLSAVNPKICDAGCGTGGLLEYLKNKSFSYLYGFDISPYAWEQLKKRKDINNRVYLGNLEQLAIKDSSLDAITCIDVLYHCGIRNEGAALNEFFRVLRPKGVLILQLAAFEFMRGRHDVIIMTRKRYRVSEVKKYARKAGFKIKLCAYRNSWLFPLLLFWRLLSRINIKRAVNGDSSDLVRIPGWLNTLLYLLMRLENKLLNTISFPFGTSVFCIASKE